jgi:subtilisin family serine protease
MNRSWLAVVLTAALAASVPAGAAPSGPSSLPSTVDAAVVTQLATSGKADVFVVLRDKADLRGAGALRERARRVAFGQQLLSQTAQRSQAGVRAALAGRGLAFEAYWIVNTLYVKAAPADVVRELGARADVRRVRLAGHRQIPKPIAGTAAAAQEFDWNIDRIRAPQAWSQFDAHGQGVVVASIDTGAQFDHPAIVRQYRGNRGDGIFDHNYNWYDPSGVCPQQAPCDNNGHGTHVTGTMVGDDGSGNAIGVAPEAKWISAKGCETDSCSDTALLKSGQWVMAPTDLSGANPRPDLAPNIVNNSWGGPGGDDFYQDIVNSWTAVGIFPVFAAGNAGPSCGTAISPGDYVNSYAVGAFDSANAIASFSSRGASSFDGELKPNVAAPGVSIRSSVPGNGYEFWSGTSMASPHVSGVVALMWSAAPVLLGDIGLTRGILDQSAVDTGDLTCGGTIADNNTWGEGRLDAYAAVERSPRGPTGVLTGMVTDAVTGAPLAGATVTATGTTRYSVRSAADGSYRLVLSTGSYQVTYSKFAYLASDRSAQVTQNGTVTVNVALAQAPRHTLTGVVRDVGGVPVRAVTVALDGTPLPSTTTGLDGVFRFVDVPDGTYDVSVTARACTAAARQQVVVTGDETVDIPVAPRPDSAGYACNGVVTEWTPGTDLLALTGDQALSTIGMPFPFTFYGRTYTTVTVTTNGFLTFDRAVFSSTNRPIPSTAFPNAGVYPFWDDLVVDAAGGIYTAVLGSAPQRRFVIEWRNATFFGAPGRVTFEVVLHENGRVLMGYRALSSEAQARGASATIGVEDATGTVGLQYSFNEVALAPDSALLFRPPARVRGKVSSSADGQPLAGAAVQANRDGQFVAQATTDAAGQYDLPLPIGSYALSFSLPGYVTGSASVTLSTEGEVAVRDVTLVGTGMTVSGVVRETGSGVPLPGIRVKLSGPTRLSADTDSTGMYRLSNVPPGSYTVQIGNPCVYSTSQSLVVDADKTADYTVTSKMDSFGYKCQHVSAPYIDGTNVLPLTGDDAVVGTPLPFPFRLYGQPYTAAYVSSNGFLSFVDAVAEPHNGFTPSTAAPNGAIYALWQDLVLDGDASVRTAVTGQAPNRRFVVEWHNALARSTLDRVTMEIVLAEDGTVDLRMRDTTGSYYADTGLENATGTVAFRYDDWFQPIEDGLTIRFVPPGQVQGVLRDQDDGTGVPDAIVRGVRNGSTAMEVRSDPTGHYVLPLLPGDYTVEYVKGTAKATAPVTLPAAGAVVDRDAAFPLNTVTGRVTDTSGAPLPGVTVRLTASQFVEAVTGADGMYRLDWIADAPHSVYVVPYGDGCISTQAFNVSITTDQTVNAVLSRRADGFGNTCQTEALSWMDGATALPLTGDDAVATVALPFAFRFYGTQYTSVNISTNGFLSFTDAVAAPSMSWLPASGPPNAAIYALWADLSVDASSSVRTTVVGASPNRRYVIEWRNVLDKWSNARNTFSITLQENGQVLLSYQTVTAYMANTGIEDATGARFFQYVYTFTGAQARSGITVRFLPGTGT